MRILEHRLILPLALESEFLPDVSGRESDRSRRTDRCRRSGRSRRSDRSGRSHRARRSQGSRRIVSSSGGKSPRPWRSHVRLSVGVRGDSLIRHSRLDLVCHGLYGAGHVQELVEIIALPGLVGSLVP